MADELPVDEAAFHAAIMAINNAIDGGETKATLRGKFAIVFIALYVSFLLTLNHIAKSMIKQSTFDVRKQNSLKYSKFIGFFSCLEFQTSKTENYLTRTQQPENFRILGKNQEKKNRFLEELRTPQLQL